MESLFEGSGHETPQNELARLLVMDRLTGMGAKSMSQGSLQGNLLGDRLGLGNKPKGKFDAQSGKWYRSATFSPQVVTAIGIEELMRVLDEPAIKYNSQSQTGVVFNILPTHMGMELSLMCIGDTHVDIDTQLQTAMAKVTALMSEPRCDFSIDSVAGMSLVNNAGHPECKLGDVQDTCSGMTLFAAPADRQQPENVKLEDSVCGMSLFSFAPAQEGPKQEAKGASCDTADTAVKFPATDSSVGMTMFERPADWVAPEDICGSCSQAGMTLFNACPIAGDKVPQDVVLDSACGMGMFSWKLEGMDEVEISKALSDSSTVSGIGSQPRMTPVGSMSSVVSALNDDDVLELFEGFAGFTFFSRAPKDKASEDELVAVESCAGLTMFSRNGSARNLRALDDVSEDTCCGMTMFSAASRPIPIHKAPEREWVH